MLIGVLGIAAVLEIAWVFTHKSPPHDVRPTLVADLVIFLFSVLVAAWSKKSASRPRYVLALVVLAMVLLVAVMAVRTAVIAWSSTKGSPTAHSEISLAAFMTVVPLLMILFDAFSAAVRS